MTFIDTVFVWEAVRTGWDLLGTYWWIYMPILLGLGFFNGWNYYAQEKYLDSLEWTVLKIKPPPVSDRSLKAAELIFAGLHGIYISPVTWKDRLFRGKVPDWFSLEIVGTEGVTNFYVRTLTSYKHIVETNIFAQYPDAEISEAEDPLIRWPRFLPNNEIDLFGMELLLAKEDVYPIQTYVYFEEKLAGPDFLKRIDPLASISEVFSIFHPGEDFIMQILIRPVEDSWTKKGEAVIDKISGKEPKPKANVLEGFMRQLDTLFLGSTTKKEEKEKKLTPNETDVIKAIGAKIAKLGFAAGLRLAYIARREVFHRHHFAAIMGALKQLSTQNLNSFKPHSATITFSKGRFGALFPSDKGWFAEQMAFKKKERLYRDLRRWLFPKKHSILNTEELATIFHLPGLEVQAPLFPRVEAKKGQPPSGLPLEL